MEREKERRVKSYKLFLASRSPRRYELLLKFGYRFDILEPAFEESVLGRVPLSSEEPVKRAEEKLRGIKVSERGVVLAADTLVFVDGYALGKPRDVEEAFEFLNLLKGRWHKVITGVAIKDAKDLVSFKEETLVFMREMDEREIKWIIKEDKSLDKAGAYAIQGISGLFIEKIEGCYFNVIGLPIPKIYTALKEKYGILPESLEHDG